MNTLIQAIKEDHNKTATTANGAPSHHSSLCPLLDFFSKSGACRGKDDYAWQLFSNAYSEDKEKAIKLLFYTRDIRGGQGERQVFKHILHQLALSMPDEASAILKYIPEYGRWDDLLCLIDTSLEEEAIAMLCEQLTKDWDSDTPSLAAKWTPSINTSSKATRAKARKICNYLGMSEKDYRKGLSSIRAKINLVETQMSKKEWAGIDYSAVPSQANIKYRAAFLRNDEARRRKFLEKAVKGEVKINSKALFPYDLTAKYTTSYAPKLDSTVEAAWKQLPNYLEGNEHKGLVVCDVSGSMNHGCGSVKPMSVALSLAIYIAERNEGAFKDVFMTFSRTPQLQQLQGITLRDKVANLLRANWSMSTDLNLVFDNLLANAVKAAVRPEEMPSVIYVVSDMQFNTAFGSGVITNYDAVRRQYAMAGYKMPKLVFWNVNASDKQPVTIKDENTALVSGCNPNIFTQILSGSTPEDVMNKVIESDRYKDIAI